MKWTEVYMNIKKFISSIGIKLIYSTSGAIYVASYIAFIFLYLTIKHEFVNSLFLMGVVLVFLIRIVVRELMLERLDYVEIDGYKLKNMKENAFQRSYQFLDFVYMMIIIFLIIILEKKNQVIKV
ncbi:hypothetical protein [Candidatus Galacturonibacter soehngenii]|uniref:Uncharacterized protein n=1 Tax=Candidatus Galacturonatibacter soehngenii TaxID=2307010 RepID=A0A7V7QLB5_9FIRM|nr:hypothetical protein [Candidatus Galacturonibacter soehngenii]KAB1438692.1 hypothetical protein F7O84_14300 [Candidatus Galacturonibacter soehngenii]